MYMPWHIAHLTAMNSVTPKMAKGFFRGCGVNGYNKVDENKKAVIEHKQKKILMTQIMNINVTTVSIAVGIHLKNKRLKLC